MGGLGDVFLTSFIGLAERNAGTILGLFVGNAVRFGDSIQLMHVATGCYLHSHDRRYSHDGGSGQQQITGYYGFDSNNYWLVLGPNGQPDDYKSREIVRNGDLIRLRHLETGRKLHSHQGIRSPVTSQQEVTGFGDPNSGDKNDHWRVELKLGGLWYERIHLRLIHVESSHALHSHYGHSDPEQTSGHQEITCYSGRDDNDWWRVK